LAADVMSATYPSRPSPPSPAPKLTVPLAGGQAMPPRRRRHDPWHAITLGHDPELLLQGPPAPRTCRDHLNLRDRRHRRMLSHTPMLKPSAPYPQGGRPRMDTSRKTMSMILSLCVGRLAPLLREALRAANPGGQAVRFRSARPLSWAASPSFGAEDASSIRCWASRAASAKSWDTRA
jgi:hypothetical protein